MVLYYTSYLCQRQIIEFSSSTPARYIIGLQWSIQDSDMIESNSTYEAILLIQLVWNEKKIWKEKECSFI